MFIFALTVGITLPALLGYLILDLLEWNTPVLHAYEKWVMGFVVGLTTFLFAVFLAAANGLPTTLLGFAVVAIVLLMLLGTPWYLRRHTRRTPPSLPHSPALPQWLRGGVIILGAWVFLRVFVLSIDTMVTPSFFDDTMDNWNLRGKIFYTQKMFTIGFPWEANPGVSSYPPTVPLAKTWLSVLAGSWNDGLVNSIHAVWFVALLILLFWTLRRLLPTVWAALGTILLASLPLELIQGVNAYADVFLSLHLFIAMSLLARALLTRTSEDVRSWLRLSAFAIALLPFTKNEGWALYFPISGFLFAMSVVWLKFRRILTMKECRNIVLLAVVLIGCVVVPWIGFKLMHGLAFGNAKGIDLHLQWQPGVLQSILVNTFFEGNWGLLFPLFFGLLILRWKTAFRSPIVLLSACVLIPYLGQLFLYMTTGLSQEALQQTGYARGIIHLMPVIVLLTTLLLYDFIFGYSSEQ